MKSTFLTLLLSALLAITGCVPRYNNYHSHLKDPLLIPGAIKVECRNEKLVLENVKMALRSIRVSNLIVTNEDDFLYIEAQYESLTDDRAGIIQQQLNETYGVMHVTMTRDVIPRTISTEKWPGN